MLNYKLKVQISGKLGSYKSLVVQTLTRVSFIHIQAGVEGKLPLYCGKPATNTCTMKNKLLLALGLLASIFSAKAQTMLYTENITSTGAELNWSLDLEPKQNIYYGVAAPSSEIPAFNADAGKTVGIIHKYQAWGSSYNKFDPNMMKNIRNAGAIPLLSWEPWNYKITDSQYTLKNIINGNFDAYIKDWAIASKNWKHPFFLRFAHEMNGKTWYPWQEGLNGNAAGEYVKAYRHVFNIFRSVGANNVVWVWCPNVSFHGSTPMAAQYPGDDYVHWVSLDGYNRGSSASTWKTFSMVYDASLKEIQAVGPSKKIMIAEISSSETGGSKASWITDMLNVQLPKNPNIKAFVWFNNVASQDWRIQSSATATAAFRSGIAGSYYMGNTFASIGASAFTIRYKPVMSSTWKTISTPDYSLTLTGLQANTEYEFQVQASLPAGGISSFSPSKRFTTKAGNTITAVSLSENTEFSFSFYPNPFSGQGFLKTTSEQNEPIEIKIIDIKGALVYSSKEHSTNEKISVGNELSAGMYFLQVTFDKEVKTLKFVKSD